MVNIDKIKPKPRADPTTTQPAASSPHKLIRITTLK